MERTRKNGPDTLQNIISSSLKRFENNSIMKLLQEQKLTVDHFHSILRTISNQVFSSAATFAIAGANTPMRLEKIRLYLMEHAHEEKDHYTWVINDLKNTGYTGPNPLESHPSPACLNYITLNYYVAERFPVARLGIAAVLESIGANFGKASFLKIVETLKLKPEQVTFFYGHGDTDVGHTADIFKVLSESPLTDEDWSHICYFAERAADLYIAMYEEAVKI